MSRGKTNQNRDRQKRARYAELSKKIAYFRRRLKREKVLPDKLRKRYEIVLEEAKKLRGVS